MNMAKNTIVTTGKGKLALFFLIVGIVGAIFQFIYLYLPLIEVGAGDTVSTVDFILSILALATGAFALILSIFVVPRNLWIALVFSVLIFTIVPVIIYAAVNSFFPYVSGAALQIPYLFVVPTNPLLDFIGFWIAIGGSLIAGLFGFSLPKK